MVDFDDLDTNPNESSKPLTAEEIRKNAHIVNGGEALTSFTCPKCHGRGYRTYGYVNIKSYPCGWCKQSGKVTQKRVDNIARAVKAEETRKNNVRTGYNEFVERYPEIVEFLGKNSEWSDFYRSLNEQLYEKGKLSENQIAAVERGMVKQAAREEERRQQRQAESNAKSGEVEISAIMALFATATDNDIKRPVFRAEGIEISKAPMNGRNAGALYVKSNDDAYLGKIVDGKFMAARDATANTLAQLQAVAADPTAEAIKYARRTGNCSCCGRQLVDPVSIRAGIGPICAEKWGLDYRRELARDELAQEK